MAKDFTPSSRNREAFEAMTDTVGNVPPQAVELEEARSEEHTSELQSQR